MRDSARAAGRALLAVHDVTPANLGFLARLLPVLRDAGVAAVNVAVVPSPLAGGDWGDGSALRQALAAAGPALRTEVLQHGLRHARVGANERLGPARRLMSRLQSAGEDEFFGLDAAEAAARIETGRDIVAAASGRPPRVFIPPAWAGAAALRGPLAGLGFDATEDHFWIHDLAAGRRLFSPVVAFATRSPRRERLSVAWSRTVRSGTPAGAVLRFAVHPADGDSTRVRDVSSALLARISAAREWALYGDLFGAAGERP